MANNRMWLVHRPTGLAAYLGKRMGWGWYMRDSERAAMGENIETLYEVLEEMGYGGEQDNFVLAMEDCSGAPGAFEDWQYGERREDGLTQMVIPNPTSPPHPEGQAGNTSS